MGIESPVHLLFIAVVALIVLGPKRLPRLARALGQGIREFRGALEEAGAQPAERATLPSQTPPSQTLPSQTPPSQTPPSQTAPSQTLPSPTQPSEGRASAAGEPLDPARPAGSGDAL
jgi:TatA/E family protein of Tat protein translocase